MSLNNGVTRIVEGLHDLSGNVVRKGPDIFHKCGICGADALRYDFHDFIIVGHPRSVEGTPVPERPRG